MRQSKVDRPAAWLAVALLAGSGFASAQPATDSPNAPDLPRRPELGVSWTADVAPPAPTDWVKVDRKAATAPWARFVAAWDGSAPVDPAAALAAPGVPLEAIEAADEAGYRIALVLDWNGGIPRVGTDRSVDAYQTWASRLVAGLGERLDLVQIGRRVPASIEQAEAYQFLLKNTSLAVGAEADRGGREITVAQAAIGAGELDSQRLLWERGSAAYVSVLPMVATDDGGEALRRLLTDTLQHPPASDVWVLAETGAAAGARAAAAIQALTDGATTALIEMPADVDALDAADIAGWVTRVHGALDDGFAPAPLGNPSIEAREERPDGRAVGRFLRQSDFQSLLFYRLTGPRDPVATDRLRLDSSFVRKTRVRDFVRDQSLGVPSGKPTDGGKGRIVRVHRGPMPLAVQFDSAVPPDLAGLPTEELETRSTRELTADEIIARHQQVARIQSDELDR